MNIIDLHCDTLGNACYQKKGPDFLVRNPGMIDLERLNHSDYLLQFFAAFIYTPLFPEATRWDDGYEMALKMYDLFDAACREYPELIRKVQSVSGLDSCRKDHITGGLLTVEEAGILNNQLDRIDALSKRGCRLMTLTWNFENCLGYPNSADAEANSKGLKPFGIEAVEYMNEKNIIVDVSHLNDGGFWDCMKYSKKPVIASHSNCRALRNHPRNLTDEMLRAIGNAGGIIGLNFYPNFLGEGTDAGSVERLQAHISHMKNIAGIDAVSLGTDFDGFNGTCEITGAQDMPMLIPALEGAGYTMEEIEKIMHGNAERYLREVLPE